MGKCARKLHFIFFRIYQTAPLALHVQLTLATALPYPAFNKLSSGSFSTCFPTQSAALHSDASSSSFPLATSPFIYLVLTFSFCSPYLFFLPSLLPLLLVRFLFTFPSSFRLCPSLSLPLPLSTSFRHISLFVLITVITSRPRHPRSPARPPPPSRLVNHPATYFPSPSLPLGSLASSAFRL